MPVTISTIKKNKEQKRKIVALTAYDYLTAKILDKTGVDIILVGDSLAQVFQGNDTTLSVTIDEMLYHTKAVIRGVKNSLVVVDLPFLSYQVNEDEAIYNAGKCIKLGAKAVKVEGASLAILKTIEKMTQIGIPVLGHIGFTPQSVNVFGGNKIQAKTANEAEKLIKQAKDLESVGCFGIVLELIPAEVAAIITQNLNIPTIGIGAGSDCDGQILVIDDLLGRNLDFKPTFVRSYAEVGNDSEDAVKRFISDVQSGEFPGLSETFLMNENEAEKLK